MKALIYNNPPTFQTHHSHCTKKPAPDQNNPMDPPGKRPPPLKVGVLNIDTKTHIPKQNGTNIPRHTPPQGYIYHRWEELFNNRYSSLSLIPGREISHIPKF